jgi:branched-chain amino acid transport system ATP-binding protein
MLELNDICVSYGNVPVLHDVSLVVHPGEIVALIGANGAGKSTTLKAIQGVVKKHSGRINFAGDEISNLAPHKIVSLGISHCPEGRQVFPGMTVAENLKIGATALADKQKLTSILEYVYEKFPLLYERRKQSAGNLSGGEQQMLAISRALMSDPKMLMLDEPSMGLAPKLVENIFEMIKNINATGITVLLVEQNAFIALETAHRAYVIENGRVCLEGKANDLMNNEQVKNAYLGI